MRAAQIGHYIAGDYCWSIDLAGGNEMPTTLCRYRVKYASFHSCSQTAKRRPTLRQRDWIDVNTGQQSFFTAVLLCQQKALVHCMHADDDIERAERP